MLFHFSLVLNEYTSYMLIQFQFRYHFSLFTQDDGIRHHPALTGALAYYIVHKTLNLSIPGKSRIILSARHEITQCEALCATKMKLNKILMKKTSFRQVWTSSSFSRGLTCRRRWCNRIRKKFGDARPAKLQNFETNRINNGFCDFYHVDLSVIMKKEERKRTTLSYQKASLASIFQSTSARSKTWHWQFCGLGGARSEHPAFASQNAGRELPLEVAKFWSPWLRNTHTFRLPLFTVTRKLRKSDYFPFSKKVSMASVGRCALCERWS